MAALLTISCHSLCFCCSASYMILADIVVVAVGVVRAQKSCSHKMLQQIGAFVKFAKLHKQQTIRASQTRATVANAEGVCGCAFVGWLGQVKSARGWRCNMLNACAWQWALVRGAHFDYSTKNCKNMLHWSAGQFRWCVEWSGDWSVCEYVFAKWLECAHGVKRAQWRWTLSAYHLHCNDFYIVVVVAPGEFDLIAAHTSEAWRRKCGEF